MFACRLSHDSALDGHHMFNDFSGDPVTRFGAHLGKRMPEIEDIVGHLVISGLDEVVRLFGKGERRFELLAARLNVLLAEDRELPSNFISTFRCPLMAFDGPFE